MSLVDGAGMGLFEHLEAEQKAARRQAVVIDTVCSVCGAWPDFLIRRCQDCGKTMCAICLEDESAEFPCYCGMNDNKLEWNRQGLKDLRLARAKVRSEPRLREFRDAREADRERLAEQRQQEIARMLESRVLCVCGHEEREHFTHHGRGCHWSMGMGDQYQDCGCNSFEAAAAAERAA